MKLAIIGASYLQLPLIKKAKTLGIETHVFAWDDGAVGKDIADFFYPISITEKNDILKICQKVSIDGITTIASDLAVIAVNYIAHKMNLVGNSLFSTEIMTNKYRMRKQLSKKQLPCPQFLLVTSSENIKNRIENSTIQYPIIVKPTDRSGSRGITKLTSSEGLSSAVDRAIDQSLSSSAIIEEFVDGEEISVETISYNGIHYHLAITDKVTTGAPNFVELEHHQPSKFTKNLGKDIQNIVNRSLAALDFSNGASHAELLISPDNTITIVEIGGRMGGDFIGSSLVELSTGFDFLKAVIDVALGQFIDQIPVLRHSYSGIRYLHTTAGVIQKISKRKNIDKEIVSVKCLASAGDKIGNITESSDRVGYYIYKSDNPYTPDKEPLVIKMKEIHK